MGGRGGEVEGAGRGCVSEADDTAASNMDTFEMENSVPPQQRFLWTDSETEYFLKLLAEYQVSRHLEYRKYRNAGVFQVHLVNPVTLFTISNQIEKVTQCSFEIYTIC